MTKHERLAKGLCPSCGDEAAPYYLCGRCRVVNLVRRVLNRGIKAGTFDSKVDEQDRRKKLYGIADPSAPCEYREALEGDARLQPRLRKIPVDVEAQVMRVFEEINEPITEEELYAAWGALRLRSNRHSAALDLVTIVKAQRKRARKARLNKN